MTFAKRLPAPYVGFALWIPGGHVQFFKWGFGLRCLNFNILIYDGAF